MKSIREKLEQIRSASIEVRKKWFRIGVVIIFLLVFVIWLVVEGRWLFFSEKTSAPEKAVGIKDFWSSFKNGISIIKEKIVTGLLNFSFIMKGLVEGFK